MLFIIVKTSFAFSYLIWEIVLQFPMKATKYKIRDFKEVVFPSNKNFPMEATNTFRLPICLFLFVGYVCYVFTINKKNIYNLNSISLIVSNPQQSIFFIF